MISSRFFIRYAVFLVLVAVGLFLWNSKMPVEKRSSLAWPMFVFFMLLTSSIYFFLVKAAQGDPKAFVRKFMAITTSKLLVCMLLLVGYSVLHGKGSTVFILHFLAMYLLFTFFEVGSLYFYFRKKK